MISRVLKFSNIEPLEGRFMYNRFTQPVKLRVSLTLGSLQVSGTASERVTKQINTFLFFILNQIISQRQRYPLSPSYRTFER